MQPEPERPVTPAAATGRTVAPAGALLRPLVRWESALVLLLIGTVILSTQLSANFTRSGNLFYIGLNVGEIAIMALPLSLIVITGEIDLSVASTLGLSGTIMAWLFAHGLGVWPAMVVALLFGVVTGAFNGMLVTRVGLPSLAVTIGTLTLYRGIAQIIEPNNTIGGFPTYLTNIGIIPIPHTQIPYSVAFFAFFAIVVGVVLHATPLGRSIFAIGANQETAFYSGIRVKRIKFCLFVLSGVLCSLAGILWTLRFGAARYDDGTGLELYVVTIVLLGGVSIFGGRGTIIGVVLAVAILATLEEGLTLAQMPSQNQNIVVGGLLIASVIIPNIGELYGRGRDRARRFGAGAAGSAAATAAEAPELAP